MIVVLPFAIIDNTTTILSFSLLEAIKDEQLLGTLVYGIGYPLEIVMFFLFSPVINGYIRAFYKAAYSNVIDLRDVYFYFGGGRYGRTLSLNIRYILRMLLPLLLCYLPLIIFEIIASRLGDDFMGSVLYNNLRFILTVLSTLIVILYAVRYYTVFTVSADNPQFSPRQVFGYNKYIMQNNTGSAAKLIFSFTPWMLLCLLILPMLYVIPYMTQSLCVSAKWMTKAAIEVD